MGSVPSEGSVAMEAEADSECLRWTTREPQIYPWGGPDLPLGRKRGSLGAPPPAQAAGDATGDA